LKKKVILTLFSLFLIVAIMATPVFAKDNQNEGTPFHEIWEAINGLVADIGILQDQIETIELTPGLSAYQVAVEEGFGGTVTEWLNSLVGPKGEQGPEGPQGEVGPAGPQGEQGPAGNDGREVVIIDKLVKLAPGESATSKILTVPERYVGQMEIMVAVQEQSTGGHYLNFKGDYSFGRRWDLAPDFSPMGTPTTKGFGTILAIDAFVEGNDIVVKISNVGPSINPSLNYGYQIIAKWFSGKQ